MRFFTLLPVDKTRNNNNFNSRASEVHVWRGKEVVHCGRLYHRRKLFSIIIIIIFALQL